MDTKTYHLLLVSLLCVALGACGTTDKHSAMNSNNASAPPAAAASTNETSTMPASGMDMNNSAKSSNSAMTWSGVVQNIDRMPRSEASGSSTDGSSGSSGAVNASGAPNDMVYRVILRMDDGTAKTTIQDTQPTFQIGDKVRLTNGMLQPY